MMQKRPLFDEELYKFSSKHPRQIEHGDKLVSFPLVTSSTPGTSVGHGLVKSITGVHGWSDKDKEVSVSEMGTASSRTIDDNDEETSLALSSVPRECLSFEHPKRTRHKNPDVYSLLLNYPPIKPVSIGSNHQADIPIWEIQISDKTINSPGEHEETSQMLVGGDAEEERFLGTCIIPIPNSELSSDVENTRKQCSCHDMGSIRCVRQHVAEANDQLMERIGPERFVKMGFCSMGEQVASRWSQSDELLFREVVQSTPASAGNCSWNYLPEAFPTRSTRDIVSYYFNVFMLRRRAEQNRCNWMDIDSDDDDLQDYDNNYVKESTDEEDESDIELRLDQDDIVKNDEDVTHNHLPDRANCFVERSIEEDTVDQEVQDGSCTSSDTGVTSQVNQVNTENDGHWQSSPSAFTRGSDQGYVLYPCDSKVWDTGLIIQTQSKEDFLPTCDMVEGVFGDATVKRDSDSSQ